jgi:hypothetical protein
MFGVDDAPFDDFALGKVHALGNGGGKVDVVLQAVLALALDELSF